MCDDPDAFDPYRFSCRDKAAIVQRLVRYPDWSLSYSIEDGVEYARVAPPEAAACSPVLTLARRDGLTGLAACWSDGSQFRAALGTSLSCALTHIIHLIEDASGFGTADELAADPA